MESNVETVKYLKLVFAQFLARTEYLSLCLKTCKLSLSGSLGALTHSFRIVDLHTYLEIFRKLVSILLLETCLELKKSEDPPVEVL